MGAYYPLQNVISSLPVHLFMVMLVFKSTPSKKIDGIFEKYMYIINLHVQQEARL